MPLKPSQRRDISGILLLDKPIGLSSNEAVQKAKGIFCAAKAGHTGSLDPLATGLLPICFGQATKLCGYLLESDKRYYARAKLGERTATGDAEGEVIACSDASLLTRAALEQVLPKFLGVISQTPPMYSAIKYQGQPLYKLAREGVEIAREARAVRIHSLKLTGFAQGEFELDVICSKGTYIRTLVEDIALGAGQQAHLAALRRLEVAPFNAAHMVVTFDELTEIAKQGVAALDACLISPAAGLRHWPQLKVDAQCAYHLRGGRAVRLADAPKAGLLAILDEGGDLLGIAEINAQGLVAPKRWMSSSE